MEWWTIAIIFFGGLIVLISLGMPICFSLAIIGISGLSFFIGVDRALEMLPMTMYKHAASYTLTAVPLFVLMGELILRSGLGNSLFEAFSRWLGRTPGGLIMASIASAGVFGAMSGSATASAATFGRIAVPEMIRRGVDRRLATGAVAAAGGLAPIIPPSIIMIVYGIVSEQSIGALFMAAMIPGIILMFLMMGAAYIRVKHNPTLYPVPERGYSLRQKVASLRDTWAIVLIIFLVLGTIYMGIATPTEAAALGAAATLVVTIVYRKMSWSVLKESAIGTIGITSMLIFILVFARLYSTAMTVSGVTNGFIESVTGLDVSPWLIIIGIQLIFILLGLFIDQISIILITVPLVFPVITALGFNPIWFGVVMIVNMSIALVTPPLAFNLYIVQRANPEVPIEDVTHGAMTFLVAELVGLGILIAFPALSLWLPSLMR